jgi:hypothetical protein
MDLMNGRFMGQCLAAAINYQIQLRELLYQLRLELGMLFLEMVVGPEIAWEVPI